MGKGLPVAGSRSLGLSAHPMSAICTSLIPVYRLAPALFETVHCSADLDAHPERLVAVLALPGLLDQTVAQRLPLGLRVVGFRVLGGLPERRQGRVHPARYPPAGHDRRRG